MGSQRGGHGPAQFKLSGASGRRAMARGAWRSKWTAAGWLGFGAAWLACACGAAQLGAFFGLGADWGWARSGLTWAGAGLQMLLACASPLLACAPASKGSRASPRPPWLGPSMAEDRWMDGDFQRAEPDPKEAVKMAAWLIAWQGARFGGAWLFPGAPGWLAGLGAVAWGAVDLLMVGCALAAWVALGIFGWWEMRRDCLFVSESQWVDAERAEIASCSKKPTARRSGGKRL
jgi:hypothetical protein